MGDGASGEVLSRGAHAVQGSVAGLRDTRDRLEEGSEKSAGDDAADEPWASSAAPAAAAGDDHGNNKRS